MITVDEAEVSASEVQTIVEEVWTTFLDPEQIPMLAAPETFDSASWTAAITVTGAWQAMLLVTLSEAASRIVTTRMLGMGDGEPTAHDDLVDALGELVNVIGGNVKSLMAGPSKLSLPLVAQGAVTTTSYVVESCRLDLNWNGEPVRLVVAVPKPEHSGGA